MAILVVRTFARYAEIFGNPIRIEVDLPTTTANLIASLRLLPSGAQLPSRPIIAVDHAVAESATPISQHSTVALLPPLAGG